MNQLLLVLVFFLLALKYPFKALDMRKQFLRPRN
jgi:hypothetical protein